MTTERIKQLIQNRIDEIDRGISYAEDRKKHLPIGCKSFNLYQAELERFFSSKNDLNSILKEIEEIERDDLTNF